MASSKLQNECLCEGKAGWCATALRLVQKVTAERKEWDLMDTLLTDAKVARANRIKSAANLVPFLPLKFVELDLGMTDSHLWALLTSGIAISGS